MPDFWRAVLTIIGAGGVTGGTLFAFKMVVRAKIYDLNARVARLEAAVEAIRAESTERAKAIREFGEKVSRVHQRIDDFVTDTMKWRAETSRTLGCIDGKLSDGKGSRR